MVIIPVAYLRAHGRPGTYTMIKLTNVIVNLVLNIFVLVLLKSLASNSKLLESIDISNFEPGLLSVHPTQVYEFLICVMLFFYLWNKRKNIRVPGSLFFTYLICAGTERFLIEFIRTNEKYLFDIFSGAQVLSTFMVLIGVYCLFQPLQDETII